MLVLWPGEQSLPLGTPETPPGQGYWSEDRRPMDLASQNL